MNKTYAMATLAEVLTQDTDYIEVPEARLYPKLSVKLYGKGVTLDEPAHGELLKMRRHQVAKAGQVILSEIWGKKGAIGLVQSEGDGALCTSHFFLFNPRWDMIDPRWLQAIFTANYLEEQLGVDAKGTTGYAAVRPRTLLACTIPLPPLPEQQRIVARIEELAAKIAEARSLRQAIKVEEGQMLLAAFHRIAATAPRRSMNELAPVVRRPLEVNAEVHYAELGVRSFGRGTFHKPLLPGISVGSKRLFEIRPGDLVFNNVFAWEGAVAVVGDEDAGTCGSHRFITCRAQHGVTTAPFLCFYFLTEQGLEQLRDASPGGAGRNRTLGLESLGRIEVPVPPFDQQSWFDCLQAKVDELKHLQAETAAELDALLPSILDRAFRGDL